MTDLLTNGDFNGGQRLATVTALEDGKDPYQMKTTNTLVPDGWRFFAKLSDSLHLPECHLTTAAGRYIDGNGFVYFKTDGAYEAGLMQVVNVPGKGTVSVFLLSEETWGFHNGDSYWDKVYLSEEEGNLVLTAYAHAWSNHSVEGFDHVGNAAYSVGVDDQAAFYWQGEAPPLTGDPISDAVSNFTFRVGIDPTGGTDPRSDRIEWGRGAHIYNAFGQIGVCVAAPWRGRPRVQYARTYVLLPQVCRAYPEWAEAAARATAERGYTIGYSADDAGIGDLDNRRVIAVNPSEWGDDLDVWFGDNYPGTVYEAVQADSPEQLERALGLPEAVG